VLAWVSQCTNPGTKPPDLGLRNGVYVFSLWPQLALGYRIMILSDSFSADVFFDQAD
jgi:hypothetical protein